MKIGYEAKRVFHNASGLGNYARNLLRALATAYPHNQYYLYNPSKGEIPFGDKLQSVSEVLPKRNGSLYSKLWRQSLVSNDAQKNGVQVFHGLAQELPTGLKKHGIKSVLTVHDLIFMRHPELYSFIDKRIYTQKLKSACQRADAIVAISEQTKEDLAKFLNIQEEKVQVIYQGADPLFTADEPKEDREAIKQKLGLPPRFALFVGTLEKRKGVEKILEAQLITKLPVVYIGRHTDYWKKLVGEKRFDSIRSLIYSPTVKANEDLAKVYRAAELFIYPSIFEGFGIPVLEALLSKVPVITSNISSLPEAAGPASALVDPHDADELAFKFQQIWDSENMRQKMVDSSAQHLEQFSDKVIAEKWNELYQSLID